MTWMRHLLVVGILAAGVIRLAAQSPAFEVVSIKESPPPVANPSGGFSVSLFVGPRPGGRWEANNATLVMLIRSAYDGFSLPGQIVGTPAWGEKLRFEVDAVAAGESPRAQMNEMLRQMLADRFRLKVRIEPREVDSYALVLARDDGKLGSGIRESTTDCQAIAEARKRGEVSAPRVGERPQCGTMGQMRNTPGGRVEKVIAGAMRISTVVGVAQSALGRPVVDRTGLTGTYDIDLEFLRDELRAAPAPAVDTPAAPSISTALQEQLGLKVVPGKHQMDVLVIEQVEMPTPN
jgi:uncharacterized protein (TIGR03435 family)